jgi:succinate dehydrogenase / fumarate reductase flavoprotein subunit
MPAHDVLIIGAGLAGQRAALAAAQAGASVAIMSKVHPVRSHSVAAAGGINAAISVDDDWRSHAYDTVKGSDFLGDQDAIEIMCSEAPAEVMHLEHIGVTFHRNEKGELDLRAFGGASMKRTAYVADITGQAMLHVLYEQLMKHHETVESYEEWFTTSLISDGDGHCCGVIARDVRSGRMESFVAKNVILACGGAGQAYKPTTNGLIVTGDGIAMAYRAGAPLMDMEMVQYHPTCLVETGILITEGARGEGAHLLNAAGERFMEKAAPNKMELASRDVVSRAEQIEIDEGRGVGPNGAGIYLDVTVVPRRRTLEALREIVNLGRDFAGVDITREPIVIRPGQHYIMGGVKTDVDGRTPIEGLYAAGEVACVSVHGGNRLGANSLLDTLIFGRRAGEHAAARAASIGMPKLNGHAQLSSDAQMIDSIIGRPRDGRRVSEVKSELGEVMNRHAAVFRDEQGLNAALETIVRLREEAANAWIDDRGTVFNQDVLGALELGYMVDCAQATVVGALERKESRGAQYRTDHPERNDEEWLKHIDISLGAGGEPQVSYSPVTITQWQPEERKY